MEIGGLLAVSVADCSSRPTSSPTANAAEQAMRDTLGCGQFVDLPADDLDYDLRGARGVVRARVGLRPQRQHADRAAAAGARRGSARRVPRENGPGLHHLGFLVDDIDAVVALGESTGFPKLMGGQFGSLQFCYLDTWAALGLYVELVQDPDAMMMSIMPWR